MTENDVETVDLTGDDAQQVFFPYSYEEAVTPKSFDIS